MKEAESMSFGRSRASTSSVQSRVNSAASSHWGSLPPFSSRNLHTALTPGSTSGTVRRFRPFQVPSTFAVTTSSRGAYRSSLVTNSRTTPPSRFVRTSTMLRVFDSGPSRVEMLPLTRSMRKRWTIRSEKT